MTRGASRLAAGVLLIALGGCERTLPGAVKEAEFGVFFGGQVQELKEIAKELDPAREQHGFRLTFAAPLTQEQRVMWELSLPASDRGGPRAALVGEATAKPGQTTLDVTLPFRPTDPLGMWHAKVSVAGKVVIDRDFTVVAPLPPPKTAPKPLPPRGPENKP